MAQLQTLKNHGRVVPIYHMGVFFPFAVNFFWALYRLFRDANLESVVGLLVAVALLLMFYSVRVQILTVQDRVIRLEMRLRLRDALPAELHGHIATLTVPQLIA